MKLLLRVGEIKGFGRQIRFTLPGEREYVADFVVWYQDHTEIVDTKGMETDVFKIKMDLFKEKYPELKIRIVKDGEL